MNHDHLATLITEELNDAQRDQPPSSVLRVNRPIRMTNRQKDIVRALACVMWADGNASDCERQIVERLMEEFHPTTAERTELSTWLDVDCSTLDDVELERLAEDEKQVLLTHAVLLTMADDVQLPSEREVLAKITQRIALPDDIVRTILEDAREDGAVSLPGSALEERVSLLEAAKA
jgi:uncharacterized membrane protein YebE (DUF533 family)